MRLLNGSSVALDGIVAGRQASGHPLALTSKMKRWLRVLGLGFFAMASVSYALAQQTATVKITPIGAKTGEYCGRDRALLFEDPTGVRILYDPGITVAGAADSRLGDVHAIIVSHNHFDHLGYQRLTQNPDDPAASCAVPPQTTTTGNTTTAEIAAAKNSAVLVSTNMASLVARKIQNIRGTTTAACYPAKIEGPGQNETVVPRSAPCTGPLSFGSVRTVTRVSGTPGVRINMVAAQHDDGVFNPPLLFTDPLGTNLNDNGLTAYDGLASGFVLTFTNGLKVYLTGDTGPTSDMAMIVRDFYHPKLAIVNVDGVSSMGPEEAAYAVKHLIRPRAVIASHSEEAVTVNGLVQSNTRTAQFASLLRDTPVYVPLSGKTMDFDGDANCVSGCAEAVK